MKTTIVIVDDHPIMRDGLTMLLSNTSYEVVAVAGDAAEAMKQISQHKPALALIDLMLGESNALNLIAELAEAVPETRLLCLSMHGDETYAEPAALAGAMGYVTKASASRVLLDAIDVVLSGSTYFRSDVQRSLLRRARGLSQTSVLKPLASLTPRELEILQLIGVGRSKGKIAEQIDRSPNTVEAHRSNIKRKLGLETNAELIRFAALNLPQPKLSES
jgi:DNA-binding NarL/FixJ family response regulator